MGIKKILLFGLSLLIACFIVVGRFNNNPGQGLDPSWQIAMHEAVKNDLTFGKDFVFTYGPLGVLYSRLSIGVSPYLYVAIDLFVFINMVFIFFTVLINSTTRIGLALKVIFAILLLSYGDISIQLLLILVFMIFEYIRARKFLVLVNIVLLSVLLFYIKFSTGLIPFVFILLFLVYCYANKILNWRFCILTLISYFGLIWILSLVLKTSILSYILNGISIIDGYSEAMYLQRTYDFQTKDLALGIASYFFLILSFFLFIKKILKEKQTLLLYALVLLTAFVLFKVAFTRIHDGQYFGNIVPLVAILLYFTRIERVKLLYITVIPVIFISIVYFIGENSIPRQINYFLEFSPISRVKFYLGSIENYPGENPTYMGTEKDYFMPGKITEVISNNSVDIIPFDVSFLTYNRLNYSPRPIPQSYSAYTKRLDDLNAQFIASKGPKYLLFNPISTENRYPAFDETKMKIEILSNYKVIDKSWHHMLMEKIDPIKYSSSTVLVEDFELNDTIPINSTNEIQIAYADIEYSLLGSLFKFLLWAPDLSITIITQDNVPHFYKSVRSIVKGGVIINKFLPPDATNEYALFFDYYGRLNPNVKGIHFSSTKPWAFKNKLNLKIDLVKFEREKVEIKSEIRPWTMAESTNPVNSVAIRGNIDRIGNDANRVDYDGWAYVLDSSLVDAKPTILLQAEGNPLILPLNVKIYRTDVQQTFGLKTTDSVGFHSTAYRELLEKKVYKVGIAFLQENKIVAKKMFDGLLLDNTSSEDDWGQINPTSSGLYSFEEFTLSNVYTEGSISFNIDNLKATKNYLLLSGWSAIKDKSSPVFDSIFVVLKSEIGKMYKSKTHAVERPDVAGHFNNSSLLKTGFDGILSTRNIEKGNYLLGLAIKKSGSKEIVYSFIQSVRVGFPDAFDVAPFYGEFDVLEINSGIDEFTDSQDKFKISGWAALKDMDSKGNIIQIILKSVNDSLYFSPTLSVSRPDVTSYFNNKYNLDDSGFEVTISKRKLKPGKYSVGILIENDLKKRRSAYFTEKSIQKKVSFN